MERKGLIDNLQILRSGIDEYNIIRSELESESNYESYMEFVPLAPNEPEKPAEPSNAKDRFLEQQNVEKRVNEQKFRLSKAIVVLGVIVILLTIATLITGIVIESSALKSATLEEYNSRYSYGFRPYSCYDEYQYFKTLTAATGHIIAVLSPLGLVLLLPLVLASILSFRNRKKDVRLKTIKQNEEYAVRKEKALVDYKNYEEQVLPSFNEEYNIYLERKAEYDKQYDELKQKALVKIRKKNQEINSKAEKVLESAIKKSGVDYSKNYYGRIDEVIEILDSGRADNLKEAMTVLFEDDYKNEMIRSQRELVDKQNQYNEELERQGREQERLMREQIDNERRHQEAQLRMQQEAQRRQEEFQQNQFNMERDNARKEQDRINKVNSQCNLCKKRFGCPIRGSLNNACPNYQP